MFAVLQTSSYRAVGDRSAENSSRVRPLTRDGRSCTMAPFPCCGRPSSSHRANVRRSRPRCAASCPTFSAAIRRRPAISSRMEFGRGRDAGPTGGLPTGARRVRSSGRRPGDGGDLRTIHVARSGEAGSNARSVGRFDRSRPTFDSPTAPPRHDARALRPAGGPRTHRPPGLAPSTGPRPSGRSHGRGRSRASRRTVGHGPRTPRGNERTPAAPSGLAAERGTNGTRVLRGSDVRGDVALSADVVVVGSGAGGAVAALRLAEAGHQVVVLEEGGHLDETTFDDVEANMAVELYAERGMRATYGSRRGHPSRSRHWRRHDDELMISAPSTGARARRMGPSLRDHRQAVAGLAETLARVEREVHASLVPDDAHSANNRLLLDGAAKLKGRRVPGPSTRRGASAREPADSGAAPARNAGRRRPTFLGPSPRARASTPTPAPSAPSDWSEVVRSRSAAYLRRGPRLPHGRAAGAPHHHEGRGARGRCRRHADVLLARSGLGGGGVGKYLRLHPTTAVVGLYDRPIHAYSGIPLSAVCDEHAKRTPTATASGSSARRGIRIAATAEPGFERTRRADAGGVSADGAPHRACIATAPTSTRRTATSWSRGTVAPASGTASKEGRRPHARGHEGGRAVSTRRGARRRPARCTRAPSSCAREWTFDAIDGKPVGAESSRHVLRPRERDLRRLGTDPFPASIPTERWTRRASTSWTDRSSPRDSA
ncbi:MAG: FAD-binding protein [Polyangiaceae bacterium]